MFESLTQGLTSAFDRIRGTTKFTEQNMRDGLKEVRRALLSADVNLEVADRFIKRVEESALGRDVLKSLRPSEQIVQVVYEELVGLMGPVQPAIPLRRSGPTVLMMCGLQGSGKTTTCGKLAKLLLSQGQHPLLVAADLQRPAAIEQLKTVGAQVGVPVYAEANLNPVQVCAAGIKEAEKTGKNIVILDTAGRLHVDDALMKELESIDKRCNPHQCYLVADALTGQDAVNSAKAFNDALSLDGVILTKLDGDARGGAALSIKDVTGVPIKFVGMGEKLDALEPFRPEGMASRILGMGDVLGLVHKAQQAMDEDEARKAQEKMEKGKFDLSDFYTQLQRVKSMGSFKGMLELMPGMSQMLGDDDDPEGEMGRIEAIISSMTEKERAKPEVIDHSRRRRIAKGSGTEPHEVNKLIKMFEQMRSVMQGMAKMSMMDRVKMMMGMQKTGALQGLAPLKQKERSKRGANISDDDRRKARKAEKQRKKSNRKRHRK
ncbi:signal recognition particle protein [bacterium]|nr:signal recognition particle protein [bacterium]